MVKMHLILLLCGAGRACLLSDGSAAAPFYVDESTDRPSDICAPFPSLISALSATTDLLTATVSLQSPTELPPWTVRTRVSLLGNGHVLQVLGQVSILGHLDLQNLQLTSDVTVNFVLEVLGSLTLENCNFTDFAALPIHAKGRVHVVNSVFRGNAKGVFAALALGGQLTVASSRFLYNAGSSGAVFFIFPISESRASLFRIENCEFEGNGRPGNSSVLSLNDQGINTLPGLQAISFSECTFHSHPAAAFQLTSSFFTLTVENCRFHNETQLVTGALTNVTVSQVAVTKSAGPLFVLDLSGIFNLTCSNFTDTGKGPLIVVFGSNVTRSVLYLQFLYLTNITNLDSFVPGALVHAQQATIWLDTVSLTRFQVKNYGIFVLIGSVLFARNLSASNSTADSAVVGIFTLSTIVMNDTHIERLNSKGSMCIVNKSWARISRVRYRNVQGYWEPVLQVHTTNFFLLRDHSHVDIDELDAEMIVAGTPLIYVLASDLTLRNSQLVGPVGMSAIASQSGRVTLSCVVLKVAAARSLVMGLFSASFEFDSLILANLTTTSTLFTLSPGSSVQIKQLRLTNVTSIALSKGKQYRMAISEVCIERSNIGNLAHFAIEV